MSNPDEDTDDEQAPREDLTRPCRCGAQPGQRCRYPGGRKGEPHPSRNPPAYRRPTGRPPNITPQLITDICDLVAAGVPFTHAVQKCGVAISTAYRWLERGMLPGDEDAIYREFMETVSSARAAGATHLALVVTDAAQGGALKSVTTTTDIDGNVTRREEYTIPDIKAIVDILSRTHSGEWTRRSQVETITTPGIVVPPESDAEQDLVAGLGQDVLDRLRANAEQFVASRTSVQQIEGPQPDVETVTGTLEEPPNATG